jgi:hypothetical protein
MTDTPKVTRQLVAEEQRLAVTEQLFGLHFPLRLEHVIYNVTGRMAENYHGGYWACLYSRWSAHPRTMGATV